MLNVVAAAATKLVVAGGSILSKNSVLLSPKPPKYTHHQIVGGLIFDITVEVLLLIGLAIVSYRTWGPPAKKKLAAAGGGDDGATLRQEGLLLGVEPWVLSIAVMVFTAAVVLGSVLFYS